MSFIIENFLKIRKSGLENIKLFLAPSKFSKPYKREAWKRIYENLLFFQWYYIFADLIILMLVIGYNLNYFYAVPVLLMALTRNLPLASHYFYLRILICIILSLISLQLLQSDFITILTLSSLSTLAHSLYHEYPSQSSEI